MTVTDHGIFNLIVDSNTACMDFNPTGTRYSQELITSSFDREKKYLLQLVKYSWAPELLEINPSKRHIVFKWYGNTCENKLSADWKEQLHTIVKDLHLEQVYKPSFYTKYFYVDDNDQLRAWAFYSASDYSEQPINMEFYQPILNPQRRELIDQLQVNGTMDMGVLVKHAFTDYIKWPNDYLVEIYQKVFQPE